MKALYEAKERLKIRLPALKHLQEMLQMKRSMYVSPQSFKTEPDDVLKNMNSVQVLYLGNANDRHVYQVCASYYDHTIKTATPSPKNERLMEAVRDADLYLPCVYSREEANIVAEQLARASTTKTFLKSHLFAAVNPAKVTNVEIVDPMHVIIDLGATKLEIEDAEQTINLMMSDLAIAVIQNNGAWSNRVLSARKETQATIARARCTSPSPH